ARPIVFDALPPARPQPRLWAQLVHKRLHQGSLPEPRGARDKDDLAPALPHVGKAGVQLGHLGLPSDQEGGDRLGGPAGGGPGRAGAGRGGGGPGPVTGATNRYPTRCTVAMYRGALASSRRARRKVRRQEVRLASLTVVSAQTVSNRVALDTRCPA